MTVMKKAYKQAFSLVELSIVLVILGLMAGGIMAGMELVTAAKIRNTLSDFQELEIHIRFFKDRYRAYPGDMPNASQFFTGAINGGGDYKVENYNGTNSPEPLKAWQHLHLAKFLDTPYPGIKSTDPRIARGVNVPPAPLSDQTIFWFRHVPKDGSYFSHFPAGGHYLVLTKQTDGHHYFYGNHGTSPELAWRIDQKIDDGVSVSGNVMSQAYHACTNSENYKLRNNNEFCHVYYRID